MQRKALAILLAVFLSIMTWGLAACSKAPTDAYIEAAIKAGFFSDPQLKAANITVAVSKGEVTLSGEVMGDAAHLQAYKLATGTPGVIKVNDQIQVRGAQAAQMPPTEAESPQNPTTGAGEGTADKGRAQKPAEPVQTDKAAATIEPSHAPSPGGENPAPPPKPVSTAEIAQEPGKAPVPEPKVVTIPEGTTISIRMIDGVDSGKNKVGDTFRAALDESLVVHEEEILPRGTTVLVRLANSKSAGKMTGRSELLLSLDSLKYQGKSYKLASTTYQQAGKSRGTDTAAKVAIGAAIGAAVGAIAGGGKGAAIGAGAGAGGGAAVQIFTRGDQVRLPSETMLDFRLERPVEVTIQPGAGRAGRD